MPPAIPNRPEMNEVEMMVQAMRTKPKGVIRRSACHVGPGLSAQLGYPRFSEKPWRDECAQARLQWRSRTCFLAPKTGMRGTIRAFTPVFDYARGTGGLCCALRASAP